MTLPPVCIKPTRQLTTSDCGIAAIATLLGQDYQVVLDAAARLGINIKGGLYLREMEQLAGQFQAKLRRRRANSATVIGCGLLVVRFPNKDEHVLVLWNDQIFDPQDGLVWDSVESYRDFYPGHEFRWVLGQEEK